MKTRPIAEQVIVITGASSGIGRATALEAARRGARVVLAARNAVDLEAAAEACRQAGAEAFAVPTDVTDLEQVEALALRAVDAFGRIDTWVNNAAVTLFGTFRDTPAEDFRQIMEVNFMGQIHGAKAALPFLEETGGALICMGSALSDRSAPLQTGYSATKHAIKGWVDGLRVELKKDGSPIRVTLIKPATINTPFYEKARSYLGVQPRSIPPFYAPEPVADAVLHAATSDERELFVGGAGKLLSLAERISPRFVDLQFRLTGFSNQLTDTPRTPDSPNNLYAPVDNDGGIRGEFTDQERRGSAYTWLERNALGTSIVGATALGAGAGALYLTGRNGSTMPLRNLMSTRGPFRSQRRAPWRSTRSGRDNATLTAGLLATGAAMLVGKAILALTVQR